MIGGLVSISRAATFQQVSVSRIRYGRVHLPSPPCINHINSGGYSAAAAHLQQTGIVYESGLRPLRLARLADAQTRFCTANLEVDDHCIEWLAKVETAPAIKRHSEAL